MSDLLPDVLISRAPHNTKHDQIRAAVEIKRLKAALAEAEAIIAELEGQDNE